MEYARRAVLSGSGRRVCLFLILQVLHSKYVTMVTIQVMFSYYSTIIV